MTPLSLKILKSSRVREGKFDLLFCSDFNTKGVPLFKFEASERL